MEEKAGATEANLSRVVDLCYEMLEIADHGDLFRVDKECGILYGIMRDDAYKIKKLAEQEIKNHARRKKRKKTV